VLIISLIQFLIRVISYGGIGVDTLANSAIYLLALLSGTMFIVIVLTLVKKKLILIAIPMFLSFFVALSSNALTWRMYYFIFHEIPIQLLVNNIIGLMVKLALPIVLIVTATGKIKTKVPLVVICVICLFSGGPIGIGLDYSMPRSSALIAVLNIFLNIFTATPYLLLALALSRDVRKEYYGETNFSIPPVGAGQYPYTNQPAYVTGGGGGDGGGGEYEGAPAPAPSATRFCGACGAELSSANAFCIVCGSRLADQSASSGQMPQRMGNPAASGQYEPDAPSGGFTALGFFFPVIGLILYLVWRETLPLRARSASKGAIIGTIVYFAMIILLTIIQVVLAMSLYG